MSVPRKMFALRLSHAERSALKRVAKRWGVSVSDAFRVLICAADRGEIRLRPCPIRLVHEPGSSHDCTCRKPRETYGYDG